MIESIEENINENNINNVQTLEHQQNSQQNNHINHHTNHKDELIKSQDLQRSLSINENQLNTEKSPAILATTDEIVEKVYEKVMIQATTQEQGNIAPHHDNALNISSGKVLDPNKSLTLGGTSRSIREGNLIEHFIVVGLSSESTISPTDKISHDAKILYSYPPERVCDPQVIGFCFPDGIKLLQVSRRSSLTEIHAVLFKSLSQLEGSDTSFMFLITGGEHILYVACVLNTEPIDEVPCFFNADGYVPPKRQQQSPADLRKQFAQSANNVCIFAPRCYCVISRFPFFKVHFDFIYSILGKERLNRINSILEKPPTVVSNKPLTMSSTTDLTRLASQYNNNTSSSSGGAVANGNGNPGVPLSKSLMHKPLPPLPPHISQNNTPNLHGYSPLMVSPSDSPLFGPSNETTTLISKSSASSRLSKSVDHRRAHSTPITNLANIQKLRQQQQYNHQNNSPSPATITDEALSAIQESLSFDDEDEMTDFTSSSNSVDFSTDSSPLTNQFDEFNSTPVKVNGGLSSLTNGTPIITKVESIKEKIHSIDNALDHRNLQQATPNNTTNNETTNQTPRQKSTLNTQTEFKISSDSPIVVSPVPPTQISNHSPTDQYKSTLSTSEVSPPLSQSNQNTPSQFHKTKPLPPVPQNISPTLISEPISPPLLSASNINSATKPLAQEEIEIIKYYCNLQVPREDQSLEVQPPGEQNRITYEAGDDNYQIENWCLGGLMRTLSLKTIMLTLSCILLEKFIIVTSKNIGLISNTIFSFIPLLKPFVYQGAFIPLLPQSTLDVLHCPIPYVIGVTKIPTDMPEIMDNCYILDVDDNRLIIGRKCQNLPHLPLEERLDFNLKQSHNQLWKDSGRRYSLDYPFKIIQNDFKYIHKFSNELNLYNKFIFESIAYYINWNPNFDFGNKEMKEQLLKLISPSHYHFIDQFLSSQLFTSHTELLFAIANNNKNCHPKDIILNPYKTNKL